MAKQTLNNNVLYGEQRTKINENFTELYDIKVEHLSAGVVSPPSVSYDSGTNKIIIGEGTYNFFTNSDFTGLIQQVTISGPFEFTPTPEVTNYLIANYNSGTPTIQNITDVDLITESTIIPIVTYCLHDGHIHQLSWDSLGLGLSNKLHKRAVKTNRFERESGLMISESSGRIVHITSGTLWVGASENDLTAFSSDLHEWVFFYHSAGDWVESVSTTTYNNTQYDDGTNLVELNPNKYTVNWVYRCAGTSPSAIYILGDSEYGTIAEASDSQPPSNLPTFILNNGFLVGRIIVQKNASSGIVQSSFTRIFLGSQVTTHNNLAELDTGDYQHLTLAEHDNLTSDTPTFNYTINDPPQWDDLRAPATSIRIPGVAPSDPLMLLTLVI